MDQFQATRCLFDSDSFQPLFVPTTAASLTPAGRAPQNGLPSFFFNTESSHLEGPSMPEESNHQGYD